LTMEEIISKLVLMVSMCLYVFIIGVTTQIWKREAPFMLVFQCVVHWTNLIMQALFEQSLGQSL
jgi:hypothetical protein